MIARHHGLAAGQTDHRLVGQQDFLHQLLLVGIAATAVAEVMLRTGADTLLEVPLLQALDEGYAHHGRQVAVFAVRLFQTVERWRSADVDHR